MNLIDALEAARRLLREERQSHHFLSQEQEPLALREERRQRIRKLLDAIPQQVQQEVIRFRQELASLPHLPASQEIGWARSILGLPNLAVMELDTTRLTTMASVMRFTLLDRQGSLVEDLVLSPQEDVTQAALELAGITRSQIEQAPPIHTAWGRMQTALSGRYVLSFAFAFFRDRLLDDARHSHLLPLTFLGESLRPHTGAYFGEVGYQFEALCSHIGAPLPEPPMRTSLHRAQRHLQLLHAMAHGQTHWPPSLSQQHEEETRGR